MHSKALYFTSKKKRFRLSVGKNNANKEGKINMLDTIEQTVNALDFYIITTIAIEDDEGAKNKDHVDDHISELKMMKSYKKITNK
jgi:hypothetical protein